ncbi:hypothetical protein EU805_07695 [Salipiger sp. IMCC34102]|uniref:pilus assembly protein n=1 Tax=Salipiger sp. IMCC34102 TaxID=2510647 RepID=UPI00101D3B25|nr:pilus assembly protein [Salipiger sp. IMCC34102]RYH03583.1 hypothetical protein EU805_07695 [Salipiger sp. IMCC34102]
MIDPARPPRQTSMTRLLRGRLNAFARDEDGALIALTLILLIPMIVLGGMAVDLMRFESRRSELQNVTDQAVLAAANLKQQLDPSDLIYDYFAKAGAAANLSDAPRVTPVGGSREVEASGHVDVPTYFFNRTLGRYVFGDDNPLRATSVSTAIEGVTETEVSLVLDISGSMYEVVGNTGKRRIQLLQTAANQFVDDLLSAGNSNRMSVSIVPYSEQVNIGPDLFDQLNTNHRHDYSHCVEFDTTDYASASIDLAKTYDQTEPIQTNSYGFLYDRDRNNRNLDQPVCPRFDAERVTLFSQNATALKTQINALQPRGGTSIFQGLKWGAALLDPSMRPAIAALPDTARDPAFANRPNDYDVSRNSGETATAKYLILVTDGENSQSQRLFPRWKDTPSELEYFAYHNLPYALEYRLEGNASNYVYQKYSASDAVAWMRSMCDAAKDAGIKIYAISVTGEDNSSTAEAGRTEMRNCATEPSLFFKSTGANLDAIFEQISSQITALRLTQ